MHNEHMPISNAIRYGSTPDFHLSDEYIEKLFLQKYSLNNIPDNLGTFTMPEDNDLVEYRSNLHGFRSKEFSEDTKLVFSGCSQTYGIGMHEEFIWPEVISKELKLEYSNLALPGASANNVVSNLFKYFADHGNPDILFCLFPQLDGRLEISMNKQMYSDEHFKPHRIDLRVVTNFEKVDLSSVKKYSKRPHDINDIISPDLVYYFSIRSIQMLEQYCRSNNIKFYWSTWDVDAQEGIKFISKKYNIFKGFTEIDFEGNHKNENGECHLELMSENEDVFYHALDNRNSKFGSHFGSHIHRHIAEDFIKKYRDNQ